MEFSAKPYVSISIYVCVQCALCIYIDVVCSTSTIPNAKLPSLFRADVDPTVNK